MNSSTRPSRWLLEFVTPTASKTKVMKHGLAALCFGDDMVHNHWLAGIGCSGLTIGATVVVRFNQLTAQLGRQVYAHRGFIIGRRGECDGRASAAKQQHAL